MPEKSSQMKEQEEQAKKMVKGCPRDCWIVNDLESHTVQYKSQKPPHATTDTPYTTNHALVANQIFLGEYCDEYRIASDTEVNSNPKLVHYIPVMYWQTESTK
jgi:hypothetical protein